MPFDITTLDMEQSEVRRSVLALHTRAFPDASNALERQLLHNSVAAPEGTNFYGAFQANELVGVVGLIRHTIFTQLQTSFAYQAVSVASDPNRRGQGIFTSIIRYAQAELAHAGWFIFGFPNEMARPIWIRNLDYQQIDLVKMIFPGFELCRLIGEFARLVSGFEAIDFDQKELLDWKDLGDDNRWLFLRQSAEGAAWGKVYSKRMAGPFHLRMGHIGGLSLRNSPYHSLVAPPSSGLSGAKLFTVVVPEDSPLVGVMRGRSVQKSGGAMIIHMLQPSGDIPKFGVVGGLADFF